MQKEGYVMSEATIKMPTVEFKPTYEQSAAIKHTGSDLFTKYKDTAMQTPLLAHRDKQ